MGRYLGAIVLFLFLGALSLISCKKKSKEEHVNPFDDPAIKAPEPIPSNYNPSPTSFEYIYQNVFKQTCDNSGCHDGTFEPDFRTVGSSYNSLVYAPVIITPANGSYSYRVMPGNSDLSILKHRLTQYPGSGIGTLGQGRMPWNDTNWRYNPANSTNIQNIINWIDAGAKDLFGNTPTLGNKNPNTLGLQICNVGSNTPKQRVKYINISKNNGPIDIWFYVVDDNTFPQNIMSAEIKFSTHRYDFSAAVTQSLTYEGNGNTYQDMTLSDNVKYNYKLSNFNLNTISPDTGYVFMRTYIKDSDHAIPSETPNNGSKYYSDYFVIKITP